jgi:hypothetical protein
MENVFFAITMALYEETPLQSPTPTILVHIPIMFVTNIMVATYIM